MVEWQHIEDTLGNCSSCTNFQQIMLKLDNSWLWFFRFGRVLQNKDEVITASSISCTKCRPYVEQSCSLVMIVEMDSIMEEG